MKNTFIHGMTDKLLERTVLQIYFFLKQFEMNREGSSIELYEISSTHAKN